MARKKRTKQATEAKVSKTTKKATEAKVRKNKKTQKAETETPVNETSSKAPFISKRVLFLVPVIVGVGIVLFLLYKYFVIAWVDYTPVLRTKFYEQLEAKYGAELKDQMITEQLILNEAKRRNVSVSEEEVSAEVKKLEDQQGGADKLTQILQFQGISMEELRKQLMFQSLIKKMFGENINITDEEINKYIAENESLRGAAANEQSSSANDQGDRLREQAREQLQLEKIGQAFNTWLTEARDSKRVVRL